MKALYFLIAISFFIGSLTAQETIEGKVMDAISKEPIPYVNIGVVNQSKGTVSDLYGNFKLPLNSEAQAISLSSIGYESVQINISEFQDTKVIVLSPKKYDLETVEITSQAFEKEEVIIGVRNKTRGLAIGFGSPQLGSEIGAVLGIKKTTYVKSANFVLNHAKGDSLLFRVNIYDFSDGVIGENLLKENILIQEKQRKGTITVDLEPYGIILKSNVLLSLEWLRDFDELGSKGVTFDTKKSKKERGIYLRNYSNGEMKKFRFKQKHKPCFYLVGKQTVEK